MDLDQAILEDDLEGNDTLGEHWLSKPKVEVQKACEANYHKLATDGAAKLLLVVVIDGRGLLESGIDVFKCIYVY